jgi:outer membrane protein OmpA-like peptidoglycan-associated protein
LKEGIEIAPIYINERGYFQFHLINNRSYQLMVIGENAIYIEDEIIGNTASIDNLLIQSIQEKKPIIFVLLEFQKNRWEVTDSMTSKLDHLGFFLTRYPYLRLEIRGHTDAEGKEKYNLKLSQKRAENIRTYLIQHFQIDPKRIHAIGFGEECPIYPNDTEEHKQKNRRVEFILHVPHEYQKEWESVIAKKEIKESPEFHFFNPSAIRSDPPIRKDTVLFTEMTREKTDSLAWLDQETSPQTPLDPEFLLVEEVEQTDLEEEESDFSDPFSDERSQTTPSDQKEDTIPEEPLSSDEVITKLELPDEEETPSSVDESDVETFFQEEMEHFLSDREEETVNPSLLQQDLFHDSLLEEEFDEDFSLELNEMDP